MEKATVAEKEEAAPRKVVGYLYFLEIPASVLLFV